MVQVMKEISSSIDFDITHILMWNPEDDVYMDIVEKPKDRAMLLRNAAMQYKNSSRAA